MTRMSSLIGPKRRTTASHPAFLERKLVCHICVILWSSLGSLGFTWLHPSSRRGEAFLVEKLAEIWRGGYLCRDRPLRFLIRRPQVRILPGARP